MKKDVDYFFVVLPISIFVICVIIMMQVARSHECKRHGGILVKDWIGYQCIKAQPVEVIE